MAGNGRVWTGSSQHTVCHCELFGVDAKKKSKLDSMDYMDEAVDEYNRLQGLRNPELDDWMVQLRGTIPDLEDPPLRNYNAETDWNAMGTCIHLRVKMIGCEAKRTSMKWTRHGQGTRTLTLPL